MRVRAWRRFERARTRTQMHPQAQGRSGRHRRRPVVSVRVQPRARLERRPHREALARAPRRVRLAPRLRLAASARARLQHLVVRALRLRHLVHLVRVGLVRVRARLARHQQLRACLAPLRRRRVPSARRLHHLPAEACLAPVRARRVHLVLLPRHRRSGLLHRRSGRRHLVDLARRRVDSARARRRRQRLVPHRRHLERSALRRPRQVRLGRHRRQVRSAQAHRRRLRLVEVARLGPLQRRVRLAHRKLGLVRAHHPQAEACSVRARRRHPRSVRHHRRRVAVCSVRARRRLHPRSAPRRALLARVNLRVGYSAPLVHQPLVVVFLGRLLRSPS